MKTLSFILLTCTFTSVYAKEYTLELKAFETKTIWYDEFKTEDVEIINNSVSSINVAVIENKTGKTIKGFGLNKMAKATLLVNENGKLKLANESGRNIKIQLKTITRIIKEKTGDVYVQFTLRNNSAKAIPLIIPTVMNPNLSPFSNSGVSLKIGQEIYFKNKGKKEILLIVDDSIKNGSKLDVAKLIDERKKELKNK
ncbi:MAG: hypothetical protein ACPGLV_15840 [Bacteroidia bacterium]